MFLTIEDLKALTRAKQRSKVLAWLQREGFKHRVAPDGWPVVLRSHVESVLGGAPVKARPAAQPNLEGLNCGKKTRAA